MATRRNLLIGAGVAAAVAAAAYAMPRSPSYEAAAAEIWSPRRPGGRDDPGYLLHYARLAANSHNTQPWRFSQAGNVISVRPDFSRATPVVDPDNHHLHVSLGCAAENLALASKAAGRDAQIAGAGPGGIEIALGGHTAVRDPLFDAILLRQSTRSLYDGRPVSDADLGVLEQSVGGIPGIRLVLVTDRTRMEQALELIVAANTRQVEDKAFRDELLAWLRFSAGEAIASHDGLFAGASGNPELPGWLGRSLFPFVYKAKSDSDRYAAQIRSSAGLAVFVSEGDDPAHWVAAGRACQRFALAAAALDIRQAFVNQPVEVADLRPGFLSWLGAGGVRPDLILRFGHGPAMPRSLRRPLGEIYA